MMARNERFARSICVYRAAVGALALAVLCLAPQAAHARTQLKSICRVKGQEENTLQGLGLVVGLKGTGDGGSFLPAMRTLAQAMQQMGMPVLGSKDLKDTKNVALVMVTATVPAAGARQGDKLDCVVSSLGAAKSLAGGRLVMAALQGPQLNNPRVFAFASGSIDLEDISIPTTGRIHNGARLEEDFFNPFVKEGKITLVLDKEHADWETAQGVAELVNSQLRIESRAGDLARAVNQVNIEVMIPSQYVDDPVLFVSQVMGLPIQEPRTLARVVIDERTGSVVIDGDMEIGPVVITHKNLTIETGAGTSGGRAVGLDTTGSGTTKLKSLVDALNALKVPASDMIDILKVLQKSGKLHGTVVVE